MDVKEIFSTIKEKILLAYDALKDFVDENRTTALAIGGCFVAILIAIILLICMGTKPKETETFSETLTLTENLLIPPSPVVPNGYNTFRVPKDKWTDEETDEWFSIPSQTEIEGLSRTNEIIASEILGAAP